MSDFSRLCRSVTAAEEVLSLALIVYVVGVLEIRIIATLCLLRFAGSESNEAVDIGRSESVSVGVDNFCNACAFKWLSC